MMWSGATAPEGWHLCDGTHLNRANYPALYAVIGHTYGGYAEDDFCIPDMRGRYVAGKGANEYNSLGAKGGANRVTLTADEMPSHTHDKGTLNSKGVFPSVDKESPQLFGGAFERRNGYWQTYLKGSESGDRWGAIVDYDWASGVPDDVATGSTGGDQSHDNRPPFFVLNYIIKIV